MDTPPANQRQQQLVVFWVLWAAFQVGVCVQYKFLHRPAPAADESQKWLAAAVPLLVSIFIRWNVIPQIQNAGKLLPTMILGIALAESTTFLGIFIFPAHQWELFLASALGIAQFAPVYAARLFPDDRPPS